MECRICNKEFKSLHGVTAHLIGAHKYKRDDVQAYYDRYHKTEGEGLCLFSGVPTKFLGLTQGYEKYDKSNPEVRRKALATHSIEFLMKVKGMSEADAIAYNRKYHEDLKKKCKAVRTENVKADPDYFKKQSRYCKEFWMQKGYSEIAANKLAYDKCAKNREIFETKLRENPDDYKARWQSQLQYWLDRGYDLVDATLKLRDRQQTFTLDKLTKKYGKEEGVRRWKDRHEKWARKMDKLYKAGRYVKGHLYSYKSVKFFALLIKLTSGDNILYKENELALRDDNMNVYRYDFTDTAKKKIIEYNGTYWHCKPELYTADYYHLVKKKTAQQLWDRDEFKYKLAEENGYNVMVVWEDEVDADLRGQLNKCVDFLKVEDYV